MTMTMQDGVEEGDCLRKNGRIIADILEAGRGLLRVRWPDLT